MPVPEVTGVDTSLVDVPSVAAEIIGRLGWTGRV